jgi:hypothetical protein
LRGIRISSGMSIPSREGNDADRHRFMADKIMPLSDAVEGYDIFDKMKVQKVVFEAQK